MKIKSNKTTQKYYLTGYRTTDYRCSLCSIPHAFLTKTMEMWPTKEGGYRSTSNTRNLNYRRTEDTQILLYYSTTQMTSTLCLKKHTNSETVYLKIIRIDFDDIWQKYSKYSCRIEFVCFSFHVGLL